MINNINYIFSPEITEQFLFSLASYQLFLERLSIDPFDFFNYWKSTNRINICKKYNNKYTSLDWEWGLSYPLFSLLEKYVNTFKNPTIIGLSGLPGCGKTTLGSWIECVSSDLNLDIKVLSLDDFYLPSIEMEPAMQGNPWNVPRGIPGSHSIDLLKHSLSTFLRTGVLISPHFDKSLRGGKGDRTGLYEYHPKLLILEGWFVGCEPISNSENLNFSSNLSLKQDEKEYRKIIQNRLSEYSEIWSIFTKIWHLRPSEFINTVLWKTHQENVMFKLKGSALRGDNLTNFIRMIQSSIPQESLLNIDSDTVITINQDRRISKLYTKEYFFNI